MNVIHGRIEVVRPVDRPFALRADRAREEVAVARRSASGGACSRRSRRGAARSRPGAPRCRRARRSSRSGRGSSADAARTGSPPGSRASSQTIAAPKTSDAVTGASLRDHRVDALAVHERLAERAVPDEVPDEAEVLAPDRLVEVQEVTDARDVRRASPTCPRRARPDRTGSPRRSGT